MAHHVTGLFEGAVEAKRGFARLVEANFDPSGISVVQFADGEYERVELDHHTGVERGLPIGATLGASLGVATALVAPGVFAAGPIAAALAGVVAGTAGGTLLGILGGLAFWWDEPDFGEKQGKDGVLVGVEAEGDERIEVARRELDRAGALRTFG
jgi:hypothetical protein